MNIRNKSYNTGKIILTGMTAAEVKKLEKIMNPPAVEERPTISLAEYIERFNPNVRRWVSKSGNAMCEIEILHDKIAGHLCYNPTIIQQEAHLNRVSVWLKDSAE